MLDNDRNKGETERAKEDVTTDAAASEVVATAQPLPADPSADSSGLGSERSSTLPPPAPHPETKQPQPQPQPQPQLDRSHAPSDAVPSSSGVVPPAGTGGDAAPRSGSSSSTGRAPASSRNSSTPGARPAQSTPSPFAASESSSSAASATIAAAAAVAPVVLDPVVEKQRVARRESWRAFLKSSSEFNRAEMKQVALAAELAIAEFWLETATATLEDVGKRIEIHDWNYQKAREQGELE